MKAMVLERPADIHSRPLRLTELPDPTPGAGEVRVRVTACAICRTDLHVIEGELARRRAPLVPGHQIVGVVDALGAGATRFAIGDRVGIAWLRRTCGACRYCHAGRENLCEASEYTGWTHDGGYAELAVVDERFAYALPPAFSDAQATPLLCAGIIGFRALERARLRPGGRLGIYGFGSSAHIVLQLARARGAEVYVCTRGASHQALARSLGAAWVGGTVDAPPVKLDAAINFTPVGDVVPAAMAALDKGGVLACAGIHMSDVPPLVYETQLFYEKEIRSVTANTRADGEGLIREAAAIPIRPHITTFALEEANEALIRLDDDRIDGTGVLTLR
ncbi:MAG: zinc-dependent alcohol dehydrogenase family protein [Deltaproteobacteria bacterium]|nr:zinc-dependent alcohol dehydrogenase family protein [Deltaproteobacteria bacterium]